VLCVTALGYLIGYGKENVKEALSFTVVLLVASIPIAIEIVCTTTLALGSRQLSQEGAIVTRLASIEEMAGMNMLCSDKTGTLTLNKMVIQDDCPIYTPGHTQETVLKAAALAAKWKEPPRDALDTLVLTSAKLDECNKYEQIDFLPFDPTIKRTEGTLRGPDGKVFKTTKGAPHIILKLIEVRGACPGGGGWGGFSGAGLSGAAQATVARAPRRAPPLNPSPPPPPPLP
jgi:H+-transporting ATPase